MERWKPAGSQAPSGLGAALQVRGGGLWIPVENPLAVQSQAGVSDMPVENRRVFPMISTTLWTSDGTRAMDLDAKVLEEAGLAFMRFGPVPFGPLPPVPGRPDLR